MSVAAARAPRSAAGAATTPSLLSRPGVVILIGFAMSFALSWSRLVVIWQDGTFFDTDDAMRLVQVRDWLGGQGWFDLVEHRLFPPTGVLMHWSRIVDVPVGGLIRLFEVIMTPELAERAARIVFPLTLQAALVAVAVATARMLLGRAATLPSMIMIVLSGFALEQFPPGRIDHHAPQITLLLAMTGAILSALGPRAAWHAALAGLCLVTSLAISLENLPFIAVIVTILPLVWLGRPAAMRRPLLWFAGSLALAGPALFCATIPPARYTDVVGDAFSIAHLAGLMAGSAGLAVLALLTPRLTSVGRRAVALGLVGAVVGGLLVAVFPTCLRDPFAGLDPVLRHIWLDRVTEAQPLTIASRARPDTFTMLFCPLLCGAVGAAAAAWREQGTARIRWSVVLVLIAVGMAGTVWQIRVATSTQPLAVLGGVFVVTTALSIAVRRGSPLGQALAFTLVLPFSTLAWALVPIGGDDAGAAAQAQGRACHDQAALAAVAALPAGPVFAPIDDGSYLLVATSQSVVAAPYHRNQTGDRLVIDGFLAPSAAAEAVVRRAGARYVAFCPGDVFIGILAKQAPDGLGADLSAGKVPEWLTPVPLSGTPYRLFAVAPAAG